MIADNRVGPVWAFYGVGEKGNTFRPAIFLDRDGVINHNRSDYVKSWEEFVFLPGALDAIALLARTPYDIVVVTNQSAIGRGIVAPGVVEEIHQRMVADIEEHGGRIDAVIWCPHRPNEGCMCRKPAPGMFREAAGHLPLDIPASYFVGDAKSDVLAARAAGCRPVLVLSGRTAQEMLPEWGPVLNGVPVQHNLMAAVMWILQKTERGVIWNSWPST